MTEERSRFISRALMLAVLVLITLGGALVLV